jgi:formate hydrogenlyase subunit 3/multisubunit Na+/H+ antiporter MnhD subunit
VTSGGLLALCVAVPLAGVVATFGRAPRAACALGLAASVATAAAGLLAAGAVWREGRIAHELGGWAAPLGITLVADPLAALMLGMTAAVGLAVSLYAAGYFTGESAGEGARFWPLWLALWASLAALFLSADLFNVYVGLELATLAAVGLVAVAGGEALAAAFRYLVWALAGSALYLVGVALVYGAAGTLALDELGARLPPSPAAALAAALVFGGLAVKGALFPLHIWLPQAHAGAPAPVSAALSALVVKASFYLVLRLADGAFAPLGADGALEVLGWLGAAAVLWGSALALVQTRLKLLVAYSTIAQLGYLYVALALAAPAAGVYLALSHACAKGAMFLSAGTVLHALGHDRIDALAGVARRMPVTLFAFAMAGVSIAGLPPSGGFVGKWLALERALAAGRWGFAALLVAGGLAAAAYVLRVLAPCFAAAEARREPLRPIEIVAFALAAAALLLGFAGPALLAPLARGGAG